MAEVGVHTLCCDSPVHGYLKFEFFTSPNAFQLPVNIAIYELSGLRTNNATNGCVLYSETLLQTRVIG